MGQSQSLEQIYTPPKLSDSTGYCALHVSHEIGSSGGVGGVGVGSGVGSGHDGGGGLDILYGDSEVTGLAMKALMQHLDCAAEARPTARLVKENWQRVSCAGLLHSDSDPVVGDRRRFGFLCDLLGRLYANGFRITGALKLMRKASGLNLSSIILRRTDPMPDEKFAVFDLNGDDTLAVWFAPKDLQGDLSDVFDRYCNHEFRRLSPSDQCLTLVAKDSIWFTGKGSTMEIKDLGRYILLRLMESAIARGFWPEIALNVGHNDTLVLRMDQEKCHQLTDTRLLMVSLERKNLIRIASTDNEAVKWCLETTRQFWDQADFGGIQSVSNYAHSALLSLNTQAWRVHYFDERSMYGKLYLVRLFTEACQAGWRPIFRFDKNDHAKSSLLFGRCQPRRSAVFCLALMGKGMLRACKAPLEVRAAIRSVIFDSWYKEVYTEFTKDLWWGMNLGGAPWSGSVVPSVALLMAVIESLRQLGWELMLSVRTSGLYPKGEYKDNKGEARKFNHCDVDTLFFWKPLEA